MKNSVLKGYYELDSTIGCGGFAKVKLATHIATGEKVAIKIMNKVLLGHDLPRISLELNALKTLLHQHICKLYQVIETDTHFYIVMEYCSGGELFDHIVEKNRLSESESRIFFRQIVSAVAYLHSLGYAHRDLKPENILLDRHQNLKLIDFGLCAKPKDGMNSPLFTSCGSPTYAAPELVSGKQYYGPEVDVWAMGVLLYALLSGSLPFDDMKIENLYKKIISGKYHEPSFMSRESLSLIKSMLQVDPKKRITIYELQSHPWITHGNLDPVQVKSEDFKYYDVDCVKVIANFYQVETNMMWRIIKKWDYDYLTSTYFLLLTRKKRKLPLKLSGVASRVDIFNDNNKINLRSTGENVKTEKTSNDNCSKTKDSEVKIEITTPNGRKQRPKRDFVEPHRPLKVDPPRALRKPLKRIRSLGLEEDASPVPSKKSNVVYSTPERKPQNGNSETPGSTRRVLGSIERSFHKVVNVLTPKKNENCNGKPALLTSKEMCNVSTTQCNDPELVINKLTNVLEQKGIQCKRKGHTLRGKFAANAVQGTSECSFELEICYITSIQVANDGSSKTPSKSVPDNKPRNVGTPLYQNHGGSTENSQLTNSHVVGIRRKRLKGDSWFYKKVCEEVLAITNSCFKGVMESSV